MQRKLVLAIIALIGLGSLAVLGSSPEFVRNVVEAVRSGSVSSIFTSSESNGPAAPEVRTGEPAQTTGAPSISEETLWQIVFTVARGVVDQEQKAPADQAGLYNNYFMRQGKLSAEHDTALKEGAAQFVAGMEPLEKRAAPVIEKARAKYKTLAERRKAGPPAELAELQRERDELTLRLRDEFRGRIGEEAFADFSEFIKRDLLNGVKSVPLPVEGDQLSPQAFLMFTIIIWDDGLPIPLITGIGGTVVDFFDGFYYDPWVGSELYNWSTGQSLHVGTDRGARWIYPALVFHPVYPTARNQWYCNYTIHYAIDRIIFFKQNGIDAGKMSGLNPLGTDLTAPQDAYYLGELQVCHRVQDQCEGLTGVACQTPTPTPSPSPTPIEIKTVAFSEDHTVIRHTTGVPIPDTSWTRGSAMNAENVVAYTRNEDQMKMTAGFDMNPAPPSGDSVQVKIRAKYNGQVIGEITNNVTVTSSTFTVPNISIDRTKLESVAKVKKGTYPFDWEATVDNGQTWRAAGSSSHVIYWTYADPVEAPNCSTDGIPRNCMFTAGRGMGGSTGNSNEYPGLYDYALEYAIVGLTDATQSPDSIAKQLGFKIDDEVIYDPNFTLAEVQHPLRIPLVHHRAVCSANANLHQGLLRSIGIDSEVVYFWGGEPETPNTITTTGGNVHVYQWTERHPDLVHRVSLRAKRPGKTSGGENVEEDPHFTYHSMVKLGSNYYDPSYGKSVFSRPGYPYSDTSLIETMYFKDGNFSKPRFRKNTDTAPDVVRALTMEKHCTPTSNNGNCAGNPYVKWKPNEYCDHSDRPAIEPWRTTGNFDGDGISDLAVWRPSNGTWYIVNSSDQTQSYPGWGLSGDRPAPGDYDGDGKTDLAVFRPSNGGWYIVRSSDSTFVILQFGQNGDKPVSGDFDGDSRSDIAVWRPADGDWYWLNSSDDSFHGFHFGVNGDVPVSGDHDGDGKTDFVVYRPSNATWYVNTGSNYYGITFGLADDIPVTGDFDFDKKADIALYRPSTSVWYIQQSTAGFTAFQFGNPGDIPMTGEFNNYSGVDPVVWSPSNGSWRILNLDDGSYTEAYWGLAGDVPTPAAFNR